MAELVSRREYPVHVDHGGFALQDWADGRVPVRFPEGFQHGVFLAAHPGRLDFTSAGHTHTASLDVEVWDAEPPVPSGIWEESATASIFCSSGMLRATSMTAGPMLDEIPLSDGPGTWSVRVVCTGREALARLAEEGAVEGVERYVAQFWPGA
ncbi:hypothetical protein ABT173_46195 [Streptomyces sp. NPDC001795]|uniref:hypothetical protein n=1 Tax=Streptomyces sp. NPDC001795 TaxID=3154525 RepID=UPI00332E16BF